MKLLNLLSIIIILVAVSCGTKIPNKEDEKIEQGILVDNFDNFKNSANVNFSEVNLEGDVLKLYFTYSGGCEKHEFELVGLKAIGKSLPPTRTIMLYHNNNGDSCRELVSDSLSYNIEPFGFEPGKEIKLMLEAWSEPIVYKQSE